MSADTILDDARAMLLALAERCEAATGADRNTDAMIHHAIKRGVGTGYAQDAPAYTASLDAAMTLVPEGADLELGTLRHRLGWGAKVWFAEVHRADGATPALALTAAALRARAGGTNG